MPPSNVMFMACGSFSPVTHMHLRMFELARDHYRELGHNVLGGIVSPVHDAYGKDGLVAATHRAAMLRLALHPADWVRVSDWECMQQAQWTETRAVLQYHQNYVNSLISEADQRRRQSLEASSFASLNGNCNEPDDGAGRLADWLPPGVRDCGAPVQLKLLCGADLLESFAVPDLWHTADIESILTQHGLVVISRSGTNPERFIFESDVLTRLKRHITIVTNWVPNEVSSSLARRLIGRGASVKYLMDDAVIEYIRRHELYGSRAATAILSPNQNTYQLHFETQRNALNDNDTTTITTTTATAAHRATIINYRYDDMDETDYRPVAATTAARNAGDVAARRHHQLLEKRRARSVFCCPDTLRVKSLLARPGGAVKVTATAPRDDDSSDDGDTDEDDGDAGADDTIGDNDEDDDDDSDHGAECEEVGVGDDGLLASPVDAQSAHNASTAQAQHTTTVAQSTMLPPDVITLSPARLLADGQASVRTSEEAVSFARSHTVGGGSCSSGSQVQFLSDRHLDKMNGFDAAATATAMPSISDRTQDDLIEFVFTSHGIRVISNKEYVV